MNTPIRTRALASLFLFSLASAASLRADEASRPPHRITVSWDRTLIVSNTTPTVLVVVNPMLRLGSPLHDAAFAALRDLHARYVRYLPWFPYPRLVVPELEPPTGSGTSWDFSLIDPMMRDFMDATAGAPFVLDFSTIPQWMFKTPKPVAYPAELDGLQWDYSQGTELRDPSLKELGAYFARIVGWYVNGGFTDEKGKKQTSGLHYDFPIWEVLNEIEKEHNMTPRQYTERYDAIVAAIHRVSPRTKFMGLSLTSPTDHGSYLEYFLNPANHRPGTPLDYISYHFYAVPSGGESADTWQYTFVDRADRFLAEVGYVEMIRKRLSPGTKTDADEIGTILPGDPGFPASPPPIIDDRYWNASGAMFAYVFANLAKQGVDIVAESQLVGYPTQYPSVTMIDWRNGKPNARYWVLKLLIDHFHPGDRLAQTDVKDGDDLLAQGFDTPSGHSLLLVNKRNRPIDVILSSDASDATVETVDGATGEDAPRKALPHSPILTLAPFAVTTVSWP